MNSFTFNELILALSLIGLGTVIRDAVAVIVALIEHFRKH